MKAKLSNKKLTFIICFGYVLGATLYAYWSTYNAVTDGLLYYIFFPVAFFPSLIIFTESNAFIWVLLCQCITFSFLYLITWGIIDIIRKDRERT